MTNFFYQKSFFNYLLLPISWLYLLIAKTRKFLYQKNIFKKTKLPVPVIIVGNISLGGTGKTPLVIALVELFKAQGLKPGVISRGYGGKAEKYPYQVEHSSSAKICGDEPLLIFQRTHVPVIIDPKRVRAGQYLIENYDCDIIISDDGLQHYALERDVEIVVVDGARKFGNEFMFPAGALREPIKRLNEVDFIICQGDESSLIELKNSLDNHLHKKLFLMQYQISGINNIHHPEKLLHPQKIHAIAGIGNPQKFFDMLRANHFEVIEHAFPDHHSYHKSDIDFQDNLPIVMTEKDVVKCHEFANEKCWFVKIEVYIPGDFFKNVASI